jgi:hypothetical protein
MPSSQGLKVSPASYATITLAITDLNAQGAGIGGVDIRYRIRI